MSCTNIYKMIKNYFKTAIRSLTKKPGYSIINIMGLAIGMACTIMILLWVQDELSYDKYNINHDRIYRVASDFKMNGREFNIASSCAPMAATIKREWPEVIDAVRLRYEGNRMVTNNNLNPPPG